MPRSSTQSTRVDAFLRFDAFIRSLTLMSAWDTV